MATERPSVAGFFQQVGRRNRDGVVARVVGLSGHGADNHAPAFAAASVAVLDASIDAPAALELGGALRKRRDELPIAALFCCPHSVSAELLRTFVATGIDSFLDLQLSDDQLIGALRGVARGEGVVRLQLTAGSRAALFAAGVAGELGDDERTLLRLVTLGLTDQEIGQRMCLSRHTIKHRIERLRSRVGARNRVQLAALAARIE